LDSDEFIPEQIATHLEALEVLEELASNAQFHYARPWLDLAKTERQLFLIGLNLVTFLPHDWYHESDAPPPDTTTFQQ